MSWFDKFFSVFLGEEKKEEKAGKPQEGPIVSKQSAVEQEKEYKKIEDTKVYYEYPKGNFRFPLVPDEPTRDGVHRQEQRVRQSNHAKQTTYQRTQMIQPDIHKKPFKMEQIPSPIYGYQQDIRPKRTEPKEEVSSVQMKATEEATQHVTLLSEEAERERNVRQQMNIPSIRKENRIEEAYSAPVEQRAEVETVETPLTLQEELAYQDHVQSTMERLNDRALIEAEEQDQVVSNPEEHNEAFLHVQPEDEQLEQDIINEQEESREMENNPLNQLEDHAEESETTTLDETVEDSLAAMGMEVDVPADEAEVTEDTVADALEETEVPSIEERQEEVPVAVSEEIEAVFVNDLQDDQLAPVKTDADELTASDSVDITMDHSEQQEPVHEVKKEEAKRTIPQPKQSSSQTSTVPFNVMMLKSDQRVQEQKKTSAPQGYAFPSLALLDVPPAQKEEDGTWVKERADLLNATLKNFNVRASVVHVTQGPSVTRFEVHPEPGVKVNKITNLSDDIKLSLSAKDIRIEAPIPGKNTIGIEVPNLHSKMVFLREMVRSSAFRDNPSPLTAALGLDISGQPVVVDLQKMPHGLIAGATGSGKSVCINTILVSLMFKASPDEVKMLLIDPKMVELAPYNNIPHLVSPVITDAKTATAALKWVVDEMERRYELFAHSGVREIKRFNELVKEKQMGEKLPYLVVVIDELADLMMVAPNEVEESICRIAQKARACGIHLLIATQRPSVDVITGLIKANIPTRIAFSVSSQVDSRTIIDMAGAEKLLGKGDMLFLENGSGKPTRLQGNFVSDREIDQVVAHVRKQRKPVFLFEQEELMLQGSAITDEDELFMDACRFAIEQNSASTSSLQRRFRIGYNRAARLIDMMEREGMISGAKGSKPREVLMTLNDLEQLI